VDISGTPDALGAAYTVQIQKIAQDQQRETGEAAVALIAGARQPPPPGLDGQGTHINTYA
jgi:hypothetical protein